MVVVSGMSFHEGISGLPHGGQETGTDSLTLFTIRDINLKMILVEDIVSVDTQSGEMWPSGCSYFLSLWGRNSGEGNLRDNDREVITVI